MLANACCCAHSTKNIRTSCPTFTLLLLQVTLENFYYLTTEDEMESHVLNYGTLSVCVAADTWGSYTDGVLTTCGTSVDHCVQAVGVNTEEQYWLIRNSWGTDWGANGYIYLKSVSVCAQMVN